MHIPLDARRGLLVLLENRQFSGSNALGNSSSVGNGSNSGGGHMNLIVISISVLLTFVALIVIYSVLRHLRLQQKSSRYVPTTFLKRKWDHWNPSSVYTPAQSYDGVGAPLPATRTRRRTPGRGTAPISNDAGSTDTAAVDRNTSVRSVMTLPAYRPNPREDERVLGREGERGGIDMVIEFPETAGEEEARREEEMDNLYQVRLARRAEIAERQERARLRREARDRGDWATYEALRAAGRQRAASSNSGTPAAGSSTSSLSNTLAADASHRDRDRRVPSVSYAAVGLARHDGTRVRANSSESERPLLSSAASMGGQMTPRHDRAASLLSVSTAASAEDNSIPSVSEVIQLGTRTPTRAQHLEADVGEQSIPHVDPPRYDDFAPAPPYESPVRTRAPLLPLPTASPLPAIEVTGTTPATSREPSPRGWGTVGGRRR
ncbi:MAG: hypothetical protein M1840_006419 [Geoglossum simile]|nr:MAG: hypothetical protein M1840_006419 [Geoglossum simile]